MNFKKNLFIIGIFLSLLIVNTSCKKSDKEIEVENLVTAIKESKIKGDFKWIVLLPGLGCNGCIQEGEAFMRDNIHFDILFVLTKISSLKILQQKTGIKLKEHSNIYIDKENIFDLPTENSIYPCIIQLENGKIIDHEFQSPRNGAAFRKLKKLVTRK